MFHPQIVNQIISLVANKEKTDQILTYSRKIYDLHQFNVANLYPKDVRKMNDSLKRRYKRQQIETLPTNWNQGQRRLFVWFIICFLFLKKIPITDITQDDLVSLSEVFYNKQTIFLDFQLKNLPRAVKSKRNWSQEEDELLIKAIKALKGDLDDPKPFNNWNDVAKMIFFQTQRKIFRTPKSCRQRWYNHLDKSKKKDDFTLEEDLTLINYILAEGKGWCKIVKIMNYSRTQHRIKNRYYTLIRKYQKSSNCEMIEQMNEERQREILLKVKVLYESARINNKNVGEIFLAKENQTQNDLKLQQEDYIQIKEARKCDNESLQINNSNLKVEWENNGLLFQSVNTAKINQQGFSHQKSSLNQSSKEHEQKATVEHSKQQFSVHENHMAWNQNYAPYRMYWNAYDQMYQQSVCPPMPNLNQHMVFNQYYCPIIVSNPLDFQFYFNN